MIFCEKVHERLILALLVVHTGKQKDFVEKILKFVRSKIPNQQQHCRFCKIIFTINI
jgi:hypothetical protein